MFSSIILPFINKLKKKKDCKSNAAAECYCGSYLKGVVGAVVSISHCNKKGARSEAEMQQFKYARLNIFAGLFWDL